MKLNNQQPGTIRKQMLGKWPYLNNNIKKIIVLFALFLCIIPSFQAQVYLSLQNKDLVWVDINTCQVRLIGNTPAGPMLDIAVCPNGKMYGIANGNLYTIDTNNANTTLVGPLAPAPASPTSLVCDKNNVLYTAEGVGTDLYTINPATGATVRIGNIGYSSAGDLTFYNDTLYMAGSGNALVRIDKATAPPVSVLIGTMQPSGTGTCQVGGPCTQQGCTSTMTDANGCICTACGGNTDVWGIVTVPKPDCTSPYQSMLATASTSLYDLDPRTGALTMRCANLVNSPIWGATSPAENTITCPFSVSAIGDTLCPGSCGSITAKPNTGTAPYTYTWQPGNLSGSTATVCPTTTTTYTLTAKDATGLTATTTTHVLVNPNPIVTVPPAIICTGNSTTLTASGATTYTWSPITGLSSGTGTSVTATPTVTSTYTVIGTNTATGCTGSTTVIVTVNPNPVIIVPPATICAGTSTSLTASGATTYTWSPTTDLSSGTGATVTASPSATTTYTVTGSDPTGCTGVTTVVVTVNPNPVITVPGATICPGASAPLTASGADTYTWSPVTGLSSGTGTSVTANPTVTSTYTVIGTTNGCTGSATVVVTVLPPCGPDVNATGVTICNGECGAVTSTTFGGTPPYTYLWNTGEVTSGMTPAVCPTVTTTYTVTVSDNSVPVGTASAIAVITVNPNPVVTVPAATVCAGASITLTASGADTYTWTPVTDLSSGTGTSVTATPATTTTYTVTGSNPTGCTGTVEVIVTVNLIPVVVVPNANICLGGSTVLNATGATTYTWSPSTGLSGTTGATVTANPAATSTYTVCGTTSGCSSCTTVVVTVGALIADAGPDKFICSGGSTTLNATGGTLFTWTPAGAGLSSTSISNPTATPAVTTTYTVVVSDGSCEDDDIVVVVANPPISLNVAPVNITCFGACDGQTIVIPSGGTSPYTYAWSSGCTLAACSNVCAGTYTLTVTDAMGCTATGSATVTEPPLLTIALTGSTNVSCFGVCDGTAAVSSAGGTAPYSYSWTPGGGAAANASALCAGTYTCTVTDANNCTARTTVIITQPTEVVLVSTGASICPNFSTTLGVTGSGGTAPIGFTWNPGGLTGPSVSVSPAATTVYTITGTDANGCIGTTSVTVIVNPTPIINVPAATICEGITTTLIASGASLYSWSPSTGLSATNGATVTAGPSATTTYTVIGTSSNGCTGSVTVVVTVNPRPILTSTNNSGCPGIEGDLTASGAATYAWIPSNSLSPATGPLVKASPTMSTTYTITGTSAFGCTSSITAVFTVYPNPVAAFTSSPQSTDIFNPTIYFNDISVGGTMVSWNWSLGDVPNSSSNVQNPSYTYPEEIKCYDVSLTVVNQFGCTDSVTNPVCIKGIYTFFIPNTFTPDGDGINDVFFAKGVGIDETDYDLWVFDRWGNLIWHTEIWGEAWDGRANGGADIAQIDTYVWKVHVKEKESGIKHNYIGHVNIVK